MVKTYQKVINVLSFLEKNAELNEANATDKAKAKEYSIKKQAYETAIAHILHEVEKDGIKISNRA